MNASALAWAFLIFIVFSSPVTQVAGDTLDAIVVTGTRTERKLLDVPVRTEVISNSQIRKSHARNLAQVLRHQPGLLLKDVHGKSGSEVWMQGVNSDRVLVLVDSKPVSASTGSTVDLSQISLLNVERIEIVKGAVSAAYGSAAMGGVINVITKRPTEPLSAALKIDIGDHGDKAVQQGSTFSSRHLNLSGQVVNNVLTAGLALDVKDDDGFDLDESTFTTEGDAGTKANLSGNLLLQLDENTSLQYETSAYHEDITRDFSTFAPGAGDIEKIDGEEATRFRQSLTYSQEYRTGASITAWGLIESFEDDTIQDVIVTEQLDQLRQAEIKTRKADLQINYPVGDSQIWLFGASFTDVELAQSQTRTSLDERLEINEILPGARRRSQDVFVQNDIFVGDNWELVPGLRLEHDNTFGTHAVAKVNLLFDPQNETKFGRKFRFGFGQGYRVPNLKERFFRFDHSSLGYVVTGNSSLLPETSLSAQFAVEQLITNATKLEAAFFYNQFDDLITTALDDEASTSQLQQFSYSNLDSATTYGVDTSVSYRSSRNVVLDISYSFLEAIDRSIDKRLTRRPRHQISASLDMALGSRGTTVNLKGSYQSRQFIDSENTLESPAYSTFDLKLDQLIGEQTRVFFGIDNVADTHRNPDQAGLDFRPKQGRFVYAGFSFKL